MEVETAVEDARRSLLNRADVKARVVAFVYELASSAVHVAFVSVFETIFFWCYVADSERKALERYADDLGKQLQVLCFWLPIDIDDAVLISAVPSDEATKTHNQRLFKLSVYISVFAVVVAGLFAVVTYCLPSPRQTFSTWRLFSTAGFSLGAIGIYEYLFFDVSCSIKPPHRNLSTLICSLVRASARSAGV